MMDMQKAFKLVLGILIRLMSILLLIWICVYIVMGIVETLR